MKIIKEPKQQRQNTQASVESTFNSEVLDLSMEVIAGLQRMGLTKHAAQVAQAASAINDNAVNVKVANASSIAANNNPGIALDPASSYTDSDLRKLRRVARACIEDNRHVKSAKQLLRAISAYREQHMDDDVDGLGVDL